MNSDGPSPQEKGKRRSQRFANRYLAVSVNVDNAIKGLKKLCQTIWEEFNKSRETMKLPGYPNEDVKLSKKIKKKVKFKSCKKSTNDTTTAIVVPSSTKLRPENPEVPKLDLLSNDCKEIISAKQTKDISGTGENLSLRKPMLLISKDEEEKHSISKLYKKPTKAQEYNMNTRHVFIANYIEKKIEQVIFYNILIDR